MADLKQTILDEHKTLKRIEELQAFMHGASTLAIGLHEDGIIEQPEHKLMFFEMLIVLLIIGVLMLLFVPKLSKQKEVVHEKGDAAVVKVVESQMELYEVKTGKQPTVNDLVKAEYISKDQAQTYNAAKK